MGEIVYEQIKNMTIEEMTELFDSIDIEQGSQAFWQNYLGESSLRWLKSEE